MDRLIYGTYKNSIEFDRSLLRTIQEASPDGILVVDGNGMVVSYNQRFVETWKLNTAHLAENSRADGSIPEDQLMYAAIALLKDPEAFLQRVAELYAQPKESDHCEVELKDGRTLERHSVGLHDDQGLYFGRVWFFRDITEHKRGEAALRELARHDSLTGEFNRRHFLVRANEEHERARRHQSPLGILMLDLDSFKEINDQYGHAAGDAVLQIVCTRWRSVLRNVDLLGRIGGEEFAILLPDSDFLATRIVAERLRSVIADERVEWMGHDIFCTVSGGITMVGAEDKNIEDALRRADDALYRAKHNGRNRIV